MENEIKKQEIIAKKATVSIPLDYYQLVGVYAKANNLTTADSLVRLLKLAIDKIDFQTLVKSITPEKSAYWQRSYTR